MKDVNIIFVDDNPNELNIFQENMTDFNVITEIDSYNALENFLIKKQFDFIFLDIYMPKMDGFDLCKKIRNSVINKDAYIYAYTSDSNKKIQEIIFRSGFDDIFEKPINFGFLKEKLNAVIKRLKKTSLEYENKIIIEKNCSYYFDNKLIKLTVSEYEILKILSSNKRKVFDSYDISELMGHKYNFEEIDGGVATIRNHIRNIRKKLFQLDPDNEYIKTIPQRGYILKNLTIV